MRILVAAPAFPSAAHPFAGTFSAAIAATFRDLGHDVVALCPRPFAPPGITRLARWRHYGGIEPLGTHLGVPVHRPNTVVVPGVLQAFWSDWAAWFATRRYVARLHRRGPFDVIVGLDLGGAGGLAWRLGKTLGVTTAGWAYGSEVRVSSSSDHGRSVRNAIERLDFVFYQSTELRECASKLVDRDLSVEPDAQRHRVLPHGIRLSEAVAADSDHSTSSAQPPTGASSVRSLWGVASDQRVILSLGRLLRSKGVFDLLDAFEVIATQHHDVTLVVVGALPPRDDSEEFRASVAARGLQDRVLVLAPIDPTSVQRALRAADIFTFTSYQEGMPNVVLEAMLAETPVVAFDISPLREADPDGEALALVPKGDAQALRIELLRLLRDGSERARRAKAGSTIVHARFDIRRNLRSALDLLSDRQT